MVLWNTGLQIKKIGSCRQYGRLPVVYEFIELKRIQIYPTFLQNAVFVQAMLGEAKHDLL